MPIEHTPQIKHQPSFLVHLTAEEYKGIVDNGKVPTPSAAKTYFLETAIKILKYTAGGFFLLTVGFIANYAFRPNAKHLAWILASALCYIGSSSASTPIRTQLQHNEMLTKLASKMPLGEKTAEKNLEGIASFWELRVQETKAELDKIPSFFPDPEITTKVFEKSIQNKYFQLNAAFYRAQAEAGNANIRYKRFDDFFIFIMPNHEAFRDSMTVSYFASKPTQFIAVHPELDKLFTQESDRQTFFNKSLAIAAQCFLPAQPDTQNPPKPLKDQFVELLQLVPTKT